MWFCQYDETSQSFDFCIFCFHAVLLPGRLCVLKVRIEASKLGDLENAFSKEFKYVYII